MDGCARKFLKLYGQATSHRMRFRPYSNTARKCDAIVYRPERRERALILAADKTRRVGSVSGAFIFRGLRIWAQRPRHSYVPICAVMFRSDDSGWSNPTLSPLL